MKPCIKTGSQNLLTWIPYMIFADFCQKNSTEWSWTPDLRLAKPPWGHRPHFGNHCIRFLWIRIWFHALIKIQIINLVFYLLKSKFILTCHSQMSQNYHSMLLLAQRSYEIKNPFCGGFSASHNKHWRRVR